MDMVVFVGMGIVAYWEEQLVMAGRGWGAVMEPMTR